MAYSFSGAFTVATSREKAFAVLSRTPEFAPLMPTYRSHSLRDDGSADVAVKVGVGKVRGTGKVHLVLKDSEEPVRAKYLGKGEVMGGAFNISAGFTLEEPEPDRTIVNWEGELAIFGRLVSLAGGLVKPIAERDINNMIKALQTAMGGAIEEELPAEAPRRGLFARLAAWLGKLFGRGASKHHETSTPGTSEPPGN